MKKWLLLSLIALLLACGVACGKDKKDEPNDPFENLPDGTIILPEDVFE